MSDITVHFSSAVLSVLIVKLVCVTQSHEVPCGSKTFPLDWSLKTKVRFVTSSSLSWCGLIRGSDESCGSEAFTACSLLATPSQLQVLITSDELAA